MEYSGYFRDALSGRYTESKTRTIRLPAAKPVAFKIFSAWLYTGNADMAELKDTTYQHSSNKSTPAHQVFVKKPLTESQEPFIRQQVWIDAYLLRRLLDCEDFENSAIDALIRTNHHGGPTCRANLALAYQETRDGSPLRRLLIDELVFRNPRHEFSKTPDKPRYWTSEIYEDLAVRLMALRPDPII